jgi:hypothetical protein
MLKSSFVEDIFIEFIDLCNYKKIILQHPDLTACQSFERVITSGQQLTKNQANFIIKILQKYKMYAKLAGLDYALLMENPEWKTDFRILDMSKKIFVEKDETGEVWICAKFPFALKEVFDKEISPIFKDFGASIWDPERKIRRMRFYNFNLIEVYEFAHKHNFEIDDTFMVALADVEEIWQNSETIVPYCEKHFGATVDLINAPRETVEWFESHRTCNQANDLLLAKSMGYPLKDQPKTLVEKMASSEQTQFWMKSLDQFFEVYKDTAGTTAVILNKGDNLEEWVKQFTAAAQINGISSQDIRVCFRQDKDTDRGFNQWVKDSGFGGKVEGGRIFIFQNKPPKWLFSEGIDVKIILTNSLYPIPSATTQAWMESHTCVCFVGDIKAAHIKDKKIAEL